MTIKELMGTDLAGEASLSNAGLSGDPQKEIADEKNAFEKLPRQTPWIDKDKEKAANRIRERAGLVAPGLVAPNHSLDELIKDLEGVEYKSAALAQLSECIKMTAPLLAAIRAANHYATHYLKDERDEPEWCVDAKHHAAVEDLFAKLEDCRAAGLLPEGGA